MLILSATCHRALLVSNLRSDRGELTMTTGRVIPHRIPICPGRDSRYTVRRNRSEPDSPWWVHYSPPGDDPLPADDPHQELVNLVNTLKEQQGCQHGGAFSINEHFQVIARMSAPPGQRGQSIHVVGVNLGSIVTYDIPIRFSQGELDPTSAPSEGELWPGPLCGTTYRFAAIGNPMAPSRNYNEIWTEYNGQRCLLSQDASVSPYPPPRGPLADFLDALRRQLPAGGRFRVNEHGRAFTANTSAYIGTVPMRHWFRPLTARS